MKRFIQSGILVLAAALLAAPNLAAQLQGNMFKWYIGAQGGAIVFRTPSQTRSGIPSAGGNMLITAKRTALLITVEEGIGDNEVSSVSYDVVDDGGNVVATPTHTVTFNDLRKYSAMLMVYPLQSPIQPFVGVGVGILHVHNPFALGPYTAPDDPSIGREAAVDAGSTGFGSFAAGLQLQAGGIQLFGMYQITTSPRSGKLLSGPTHSLLGGLRVSLGGAKESITGSD